MTREIDATGDGDLDLKNSRLAGVFDLQSAEGNREEVRLDEEGGWLLVLA